MTIDLDELERIGKAATTEQWEAKQDDLSSDPAWYVLCVKTGDVLLETNCGTEADARFIVFARNNWQEMIDRLRLLEDTVSRIQRASESLTCGCGTDADATCDVCEIQFLAAEAVVANEPLRIEDL